MYIIEFITTITIVLCLIVPISYLLLLLQKKYPSNEKSIVSQINLLLPQTQCGQCNYPGCKPYATAISKDLADINLCPPGGQETIDALSSLLNIESKPLNNSTLTKKTKSENLTVALINEQECIGCMLCIKACPVDAIIGTKKMMHTVISEQCTGCELCIAPCPMDCITMVEQFIPIKYWTYPKINSK